MKKTDTTLALASSQKPKGWLRRWWSSVRSPAVEAKAQETPRRPTYHEVGASGTRINGGWISGYEQNRDLTGVKWALTAEEMVRTDPAVASVADAFLQTLLSATPRFQPVEGSDASVEAAGYLHEAFGLAGKRGRLQGGFESALATLLNYVLTGFRYAEEVYTVDDGRVWLHKYADREPSAHQRWLVDANGDLTGVEQSTLGSPSPLGPIPAHKLILLTHHKTGQNYEGRGLLRSMYMPYLLKRQMIDLLAIGSERWATPTPVVQIDLQTLAAVAEQIPALEQDLVGYIGGLVEAAKAEAAAYTSHQSSYLVEPPGLRYGTYGDGSFDPAKLLAVIDACDNQIASAALLNFLRLGVNDTGSRAVGEVQESFFRRSCTNILDQVASVVGGPAGPGTGTAGRLLLWNFPGLPEAEYPRMVFEGLNPSPLVELLGQLPGLTQAQILKWTDKDQDALRHATGLDPLPVEGTPVQGQ